MDRAEEKGFVSWLPSVPATCKIGLREDMLDNFVCCHSEIEVVDQACCLTELQYILTPGQPAIALTL